jgi:type II secretory pathway pseudopilin PulG
MMKFSKSSLGMTLVELITSLLISSILISSVFFLTKMYKQNTNQLKQEIDTQLYVSNFINVFTTDIASAGYQPIDSQLTVSILEKEGNGKDKVIDVTYKQGYTVDKITIRYDIGTVTRTKVEYSLIDFKRSNARPNEKAIIKSKENHNDITKGVQFNSIGVINNEIILAGVEDFQCRQSINPEPTHPNAAVRGLNCTLTIYKTAENQIVGGDGGGNLNSTQTRSYTFYAKAINLF